MILHILILANEKCKGGKNVNVKICKFISVFICGALCYGFMEILNRGYTHITMGILGGTSFLVIHILNGERREGKRSLFSVLCLSGLFITSIEFISGEYLNKYLDLNIWTYEDMPLNFDGQICLPFALLWIVLSFVGVMSDDFIRYKIFKEAKNYNYFIKENNCVGSNL